MAWLRLILHGKAAANPRVRAAVAAVREEGHRVEVRVTWEAGDAERMTAEAVADAKAGRVDTIVAGGGDGTVNEVFGASYGAGLPPGCSLGVLPLGTANDFAHSAGIPVEDLTAALRLVTAAPPHMIDLGLFDGRPFVNLLSGGFGSRVTAETDPELKRRLGGLAYVLTGVSRFRELAPSRGRVRADNFSWEGSFLALAVGNGRMAGGGMPLCPDAVLDDGLLDLMILPEPPADARIAILMRLLREGAAGIQALQVTARSSWFEYEAESQICVNLDGEHAHGDSFRIECLREVLPVHLGGAASVLDRRPAHLVVSAAVK